MRKLITIILAAMMLTLCGCGENDSNSSPGSAAADFTDAESFEKALNNGEDAVGKTVTFAIKEVNNWSDDFYNLWTGEHLNFVFPKDRTYEPGETVTVEIKVVEKLPSSDYTSWILNDESRELSSLTDIIGDLGSSAPEKEFKEKVIYDRSGLKVTFTGIDTDFWGPKLKLLIENSTYTNYTVQCRDFSINDYTLSTVFSANVGAGKKAVDSIGIRGMDDAGLSQNDIKKIEFKLHFFDSDSWSGNFDSPIITLLP